MKDPNNPKQYIPDPENILIFKDTHEATIDRKTFEMVQRHFAGRKRPDKQGEVDKYAGLLFCGECGKRLYLHRGNSIRIHYAFRLPEQEGIPAIEVLAQTTPKTA